MPMFWAAGIAAAGSIISGQLAAGAQTDASNQSTQVQMAQNAEARRQYDTSRADLAPYRNVGYSALSTLAGSSGLTPPAGGGGPAATAWGAPTASAAAPSPAMTPGMLAAQQAAGTRGGGGRSGGQLGQVAFGLMSGRKNNSAIQDISQALALGRTITDAQWAQAGFGPGGSDPHAPQQTAATASPVLQTVPLDQGNPTIAPPGTNAPTNDFNRPFTLADFQQDPGYEFRRSEGARGVEASGAVRSGALSGATLKALDRYNSDYASSEYGNAFNRYQTDLSGRFNRLSSLAGTGQTAVGQTVDAGTNLTGQLQTGANNVQNNIASAGNARSSGYVAAGNGVGNAAGGIGQYYQLKSFLNPSGGSDYPFDSSVNITQPRYF